MIQIDGLSMPQFERALAKGRLPFICTLMNRDGYRKVSLYSGLPSATPAVQAELFYGARGAVPAFEFHDRANGVHMSCFTRLLQTPSAAALKKPEGPCFKADHPMPTSIPEAPGRCAIVLQQ